MAPEKRGSGFNPEAQSNPYAQIPDLVQRSILARPKDSRRAQSQLSHLVKSSEHFDPVIIAASDIQRTLVQPSQQAERIKTGVTLLNKIVLEGIGRQEPNINDDVSSYKTEISVRIGPETLAAAQSLEANDLLVKKSRFISSQLPSTYEYLMGMASSIRKGANQGKTMLTIVHVEKPKGDPSFSLEPINSWAESVQDLCLKISEEPKMEVTSRAVDDLVDLLKEEPENSVPGRKKLYTRKYGQASLADMENMQYPLSEEDYDKVTNFLLLAFSDDAQPLREEDKKILFTLFSHLTTFEEITGPVSIRNQSILATINSWRENFVENLLFAEDERKNSQIKQLIGARAVDLAQLMWNIPHQFQGNPDLRLNTEHTLVAFSGHPITYRYLNEYLARNPSHQANAQGVYSDELGREYLEDVAIPRFRERLTEFGLIEEKEDVVVFLENHVKERPYSKTHLEGIKTVFELKAGPYFLERLNERTEEMEDIADTVWEETNQNVHFLPLSKGSEAIEFSADSLPNLLGLRSIEFTMQDVQRGEVLVRFRFLDTAFSLFSTLDLKEEGNKLQFKTALQEDSPGLYTMLNLISALSMRDLVMQETNERKTEKESLPTKNTWQKLRDLLRSLLRNRISKKSEELSDRSLPRVRYQKDQDVINSIHRDFPQRRVSLHRRALVGAQDYWSSVGEYINSLANNTEKERIQALEGKVENTRKKLYRISGEKKKSLPPSFQLETIEDPITGEEFYLETWVVEHTSPKPTAEELSSPLQLFRRYYRNSSALAFLDQLKPWFVGQ